MLQIIGWLGCLYLLIKGLEIAGSTTSLQPSAADPDKLEFRPAAYLALVLAIAGAIGFAFWLGLQASAFETSIEGAAASDFDFYTVCLDAAETPEATIACANDASR